VDPLAPHRPPPPGRLVLAPSLDYLERAYDDVKYRRTSERPYLETRAEGTSLHVHAQYVPRGVADGALGAHVEAQLAPHLGGARVLARSVRVPRDLEAAYGWPEGQRDHAELALDQLLWMRPTAALARYRTPIDGLWLCGPAMHPGRAGAAGACAARLMLQQSSEPGR
jgi:phytoene dehydrogenase-like protein